MSSHPFNIPNMKKAIISNNGKSDIKIHDLAGEHEDVVIKPGDTVALPNPQWVNIRISGDKFGLMKKISAVHKIELNDGDVTIKIDEYDA